MGNGNSFPDLVYLVIQRSIIIIIKQVVFSLNGGAHKKGNENTLVFHKKNYHKKFPFLITVRCFVDVRVAFGKKNEKSAKKDSCCAKTPKTHLAKGLQSGDGPKRRRERTKNIVNCTKRQKNAEL